MYQKFGKFGTLPEFGPIQEESREVDGDKRGVSAVVINNFGATKMRKYFVIKLIINFKEIKT